MNTKDMKRLQAAELHESAGEDRKLWSDYITALSSDGASVYHRHDAVTPLISITRKVIDGDDFFYVKAPDTGKEITLSIGEFEALIEGFKIMQGGV